MNDQPLFSLVLRTKNEINNIENFVKSVNAQLYKNIEFIVVDNYSTDGTYNYLVNNNITVYQKGPERTAQGNFGMLIKSTGKYVGYFDADMILSPDLISSAVQYLEKNKAVALHIREVILGRGFLSSVRRFERAFYEGTLIDAARIFRRSTLLKVGGFDEVSFVTPSAEDWDLDKRIKEFGNIDFLDLKDDYVATKDASIFLKKSGINDIYKYSPCFFHNERDFSLKWYLAKKKYYSKSISKYIEKWGQDDPDLRKQLGFYYRYFYVFIENKKWKFFFKNPLFFLAMYINLIAVGVVFLMSRRK